jgi:hypothetical protein
MAVVELHAMKPQLDVIEEVERGEGDALVLWHLADEEVTLAMINQGKGSPVPSYFGNSSLCVVGMKSPP